MNCKILFLLLGVLNISLSFAQVGIGTDNPHPSTVLDVEGTNTGVRFPSVTDLTQIVSPAVGLVVFYEDGADRTLVQNIGTEAVPIWQRLGAGAGSSFSFLAEFEVTAVASMSMGSLHSNESIIRGSVVHEVTVNVIKEGAYMIETESVNGFRFVAHGYFYPTDVAAGSVKVLLLAEGMPMAPMETELGFVNNAAPGLKVKTTVNTPGTSTSFVLLSIDATTVYSEDVYTLTLSTVGIDPADNPTYEWYEDGKKLTAVTGLEYTTSVVNDVPNSEGKYKNIMKTYSCIVKTKSGDYLSNILTITILPPWGKNGFIQPGLEVREFPWKKPTDPAYPGAYTYHQAREACRGVGSGFRMPFTDETIKLCLANVVDVCANDRKEIIDPGTGKPEVLPIVSALWVSARFGYGGVEIVTSGTGSSQKTILNDKTKPDENDGAKLNFKYTLARVGYFVEEWITAMHKGPVSFFCVRGV